MITLHLSVQQQSMISAPINRYQIKKTITHCLKHANKLGVFSIAIRLVDEEESQQHNEQYRQKNKPTNVLSFPSGVDHEMSLLIAEQPLGDMIICMPVVNAEAIEQNKTLAQHFRHMLVHGTLHLLGYDHEKNQVEAELMESLEISILAGLNVANPYIVK